MPSTISSAIYVYILALIALFQICDFLIFFIIPSKVNKWYKGEIHFNLQFNNKIFVTRALFCAMFILLFIGAVFFMNQSSNKYIHFVGFIIFIIINTLLISGRKIVLSKPIFKYEIKDNVFEPKANYTETIVLNNEHIETSDILDNSNRSLKTNSTFSNTSDKVSNKPLKNVQNRSIISPTISDSEILIKYKDLNNKYDLFCNEKDFRSMLAGQEVKEKIVFLDSNNIEPKLTIIEYLAVLNFIVDGRIENFKSSVELINWIHKNFNLDKIKKEKLSSRNISAFRDAIKNETKSNFR